MSKAFTVLAECVDIRSGKRYQRGETFDPAPNPEQAKRLVAAGCLPEEAIKGAVGAKTEAERALEDKASWDRAAAEKAKLKAASTKTKQAGGDRQDGPTITEYVAAGYSASDYPPKGYVSRSTVEEIEAAIAEEKAKAAADGLPENTVDELKAIAEAEKVDLGDVSKKDDIIAAIRAHRGVNPGA